MSDELGPGWAEALGQASTSKDERKPGRRNFPVRMSTAQHFKSQLNGARNGGVDKAKKLDKVLGKVEDE